MASFLITLLLLLFLLSHSAASAKLSYADHCDSVVPHATPTRDMADPYTQIYFNTGYFPNTSTLFDSSSSSLPGSFQFYSKSLYRTADPAVFKLDASLYLNPLTNSSRSNRYYVHNAAFELSGFWSKTLGKICMVGASMSTSKVVFKLDYPQSTDISTSIVTGSLQSMSSQFQTIPLLTYAQNNYTYTRTSQASQACARVDVPKNVFAFSDHQFCESFYITTYGWFELDSGEDCSFIGCARFMRLNDIGCGNNGSVHMTIIFSNNTNYERRNIMDPETTLVVEGVWDSEKNALCMLGYPITRTMVSDSDAAGISLWFPETLTIEKSSIILGQIWSTKTKASRGVGFRKFGTNKGYLTGTRYKYTKTDKVKNICGSGSGGSVIAGRFPDGTNVNDLRFDLSVNTEDGSNSWGSLIPISIGETFYGSSSVQLIDLAQSVASIDLEEDVASTFNVSYKLSYTSYYKEMESNTPVDISAEGIYDASTGLLCMVGCRNVNITVANDCEILIKVQLAEMNTGNGNFSRSSDTGFHLKGTIQSLRKNEDHLYFAPLQISSNNMYSTEAKISIWRMDVEIVMVLVSKTLSCVFIALQLFYIKKHPEVVSSISVAMLVVLTLGNAMPLLLNFEAMFVTHWNKQNVLMWSGGWLEANEVIVRVLTMLTFLLQLRLLQPAWAVRGSRVSETKAVKFYLPLYFAGAVITWLAHSGSYQDQSRMKEYKGQRSFSIWDDLMSYAGLLLDGFLLPQIVLNAIGNITEKALSPFFYVGITIVRAFPHLYNVYRTRYYFPAMESSIIYASPYDDLYSYVWDILIPLGGVIFAVVVFLQQRFGGSFFLPKRFKSVGAYELVSV